MPCLHANVDLGVSQEELLAEAAKTELENEKSLQMILAREEEVKKRQAAAATERPGPTVRYHSRATGSSEKDKEVVRHLARFIYEWLDPWGC